MALRILLVGLVAALALDLPGVGSSRGPRLLDARLVPRATERVILVAEPAPTVPPPDLIARSAEETVTPPAATVEPIPAVRTDAPVESVATKIPDAPAAIVSFDGDLLGRADPAPEILAEVMPPDAAVIPMPMPAPAPEVAEAPAAPSPLPVVLAPTFPIPSAPEAAPVATAPDVKPVMAPASELPVEVASPVSAIQEEAKPAEEKAVSAEDRDAAFSKVMGEVVASFASDLAANPRPEAPSLLARDETAPPPAAPAQEVAAFAPPAEAAPIAPEDQRIVEAAPDELADPAPAPAAVAAKADPAPEEAPAAPVVDLATRAGRLAQAVKLTGEAMSAWAGLLSQRPATASGSIQR